MDRGEKPPPCVPLKTHSSSPWCVSRKLHLSPHSNSLCVPPHPRPPRLNQEYTHPLLKYYRMHGRIPPLSFFNTYLCEIVFFWRFMLFTFTVGYKLFLSLAAYYIMNRCGSRPPPPCPLSLARRMERTRRFLRAAMYRPVFLF